MNQDDRRAEFREMLSEGSYPHRAIIGKLRQDPDDLPIVTSIAFEEQGKASENAMEALGIGVYERMLDITPLAQYLLEKLDVADLRYDISNILALHAVNMGDGELLDRLYRNEDPMVKDGCAVAIDERCEGMELLIAHHDSCLQAEHPSKGIDDIHGYSSSDMFWREKICRHDSYVVELPEIFGELKEEPGGISCLVRLLSDKNPMIVLIAADSFHEFTRISLETVHELDISEAIHALSGLLEGEPTIAHSVAAEALSGWFILKGDFAKVEKLLDMKEEVASGSFDAVATALFNQNAEFEGKLETLPHSVPMSLLEKALISSHESVRRYAEFVKKSLEAGDQDF
jgi:hypothetical protein